MAILVMSDPDFGAAPELGVYWKALGRFIHRFAMLEQQIAYLLALYTKAPDGTAQAVFSGTKAALALSLIERIREVREMPDDPDWDRAKTQFGVINSVRNDVVHFGATLHDGAFTISNKARAIPRQLKITPISAAELACMTEDVQTIAATVFVHQLIEKGINPTHYTTDWREVGRAPWKYKQAQQDSSQRKNQRGKGREAQRPPSPE